METRKKIRGRKEGILTEDICSVGGSMHKKGSIVRYRRFKEYDSDKGHATGKFEYHYTDLNNGNLVRMGDELLIEPEYKNQSEDGLHKKLQELVYRLQELTIGYLGEDYSDSVNTKIGAIGMEIKSKKLIEKSSAKHFAKQLMMKNNVPEEYWK